MDLVEIRMYFDGKLVILFYLVFLFSIGIHELCCGGVRERYLDFP